MALLQPPEQIEQQALAAYDRDRLDKILMLLYPITEKVVYTEFGLERLQLDRHRLPPYGQALKLTSALLVIPYLKGRSEADVRSFTQSTAYINDIHEPPLYKGELVGDTLTFDKYIEEHPLFSCLDMERTIISVTLRDNTEESDADLLARMMTSVRLELGTVTTDGHIISSSIDHYDMATDLTSCSGNIIGYVIAAKNKTAEYPEDGIGHAMALIIDKQQRTIELADSNGYTKKYSFIYTWLGELVSKLNRRQPVPFTLKYSFNMGYCPQLRIIVMQDRNIGQCLVWTWYYLWLRVNNPHRSAEEIVRHIMAMTAVQLQDRIERVGSIIYNNYTFGDLDEFRNIKSWLSSSQPNLHREQIARGIRYLTRQDDPLACLINTFLTPIPYSDGVREVSHYWTVDDLLFPTLVIRPAEIADYLLGLRLNESSVHYQYCYAFRNHARLFHGIVYDQDADSNQSSHTGLLFLEYVPGISLRTALRQRGWREMGPTVARLMRILKHTYNTIGYVIAAVTLDSVIIRPDGVPVILQGPANTTAGDSRMSLLEELRAELPDEDIFFLSINPLDSIQKKYPAKKKDPTEVPEVVSALSELPFRNSIGYTLLQNGTVPTTLIDAMEAHQMAIIFNTELQHTYHILQTIYLYLQVKDPKLISPHYVAVVRQRLSKLLADLRRAPFHPSMRWLLTYI